MGYQKEDLFTNQCVSACLSHFSRLTPFVRSRLDFALGNCLGFSRISGDILGFMRFPEIFDHLGFFEILRACQAVNEHPRGEPAAKDGVEASNS